MDQKILERFFRGKCSPEEHRRIKSWYLSGEADKALSEKIEAHWEEEENQNHDHWGREALFEEISEQIHETPHKGKIINLQDRTSCGNKWKHWPYAAAVAVLMVLSGWWYSNSFQEHAG
ncbi:MAG: hypothetical protein WD426_09060, partial [Anditalea sp.]